jgi:hypothetical protein
MNDEIISVLLQKKQIILQGAPGVGKTYTAKKIAQEIIAKQKMNLSEPETISDNDIRNMFQSGQTINSSRGKTTYIIRKINTTNLTIGGNGIQDRNISFKSIKEAYDKKLWEPGKQDNGLDPYTSSLAKFIYENLGNEKENYPNIKLIQFHPSYTYEDFVRGIVVENENEQIKYSTRNKIFGEFADEALKNWENSRKTVEEISKEQGYGNALDIFKEHINDLLINGEEFKIPNTTANIVNIENGSFQYSFKDRPTIFYNLLFSDIIKIGLNKEHISRSIDVENVGLKMKGKYPYYYHFFNAFEAFVKDNKIILEQKGEKINEQNYLLIIDEINRANLPTVLGELIYALEYRGEKVESMYTVEGDNKLTLPPNLYIIGTMNTADRSVGQIDYAIRRRFAFIEILPEVLDIDGFDEPLFKDVSELFISNYDDYVQSKQANESIVLKKSEYLSDEFRPEDVWLGHSYFIMEDSNRNIRLNYEIKPILREYLKDGIFKPDAEKIINGLK